MKLKSISAKNFKGQSFEMPLDGALTIITGNNFVGKSSRIEAVMLALAGYLPGIERKPNAIYDRLSSGNPMSLMLDTTKGTIKREWSKAKSSVTAKAEFKGVPEGWTCEPVVIDSDAFLALSSTARIKYLFSKAEVEDPVTPETVIEALNKVVEMNASDAKAVLEIIAEWKSEITAAQQNKGTLEWLEVLAESAKQWKSRCEADLRANEGGTQVIGQAMGGGKFLKEQEVKEALQKAQQDYAIAKSILDNAIAKAQETQRLVEQAKASEKDSAIRGELNQKLAVAKQDLAALPPTDVEAGKKLAAESVAAQQELSAANMNVVSAQNTYNAINEEVATKTDKVKNFGSLTCCPTCKAKARGWKAEVEKELNEQLEDAIARHNAAAEKLASAKQAANRAKEKSTDLTNVLEAKRDAVRKRMAVEKVIQELESAIKGHEPLCNLTVKEAAEQHATAVREALEAEKTCDAARVTLNQATEQHGQWAAQKRSEDTLKTASERMAKLTIELSVAKAAAKAVAKLQSDLVEYSIGTVLTRMNEFCGDILVAPLAYSDGDIGMERDGNFVSFRSFSGTEKALTQCAISLALASSGQVRLAILDEMGRLDSTNKLRVAKKALQLVAANKLDHALFIDVDAKPYAAIQSAQIKL